MFNGFLLLSNFEVYSMLLFICLWLFLFFFFFYESFIYRLSKLHSVMSLTLGLNSGYLVSNYFKYIWVYVFVLTNLRLSANFLITNDYLFLLNNIYFVLFFFYIIMFVNNQKYMHLSHTTGFSSSCFIYLFLFLFLFFDLFVNWFIIFFMIEFLTFITIGFLSCFKHKNNNLLFLYLVVSIVSSLLFLIFIWLFLLKLYVISYYILCIFYIWKLGILPFGLWSIYFYKFLNSHSLVFYVGFLYLIMYILIISLQCTFFVSFKLMLCNLYILTFIATLSIIVLIFNLKLNGDMWVFWLFNTWSTGLLFIMFLL